MRRQSVRSAPDSPAGAGVAVKATLATPGPAFLVTGRWTFLISITPCSSWSPWPAKFSLGDRWSRSPSVRRDRSVQKDDVPVVEVGSASPVAHRQVRPSHVEKDVGHIGDEKGLDRVCFVISPAGDRNAGAAIGD